MSRMLVVMSVCLALASPGVAQTLQPVYVDLQLPQEIANLPLEIDRVATRANLNDTLIRHLKGTFPYWDFQSGPPDALPRLRIEIFGGTPATPDLFAQLWVQRQLYPEKTVGPVLRILAAYDYVDRRDAPDYTPLFVSIGNSFSSELNRSRTPVLDDFKSAVRLGQGVIMAALPAEEAVLPLPWEKFAPYSKSRFKILCTNNAGAADLFSEANGKNYLQPMPRGLFIWVRHDEVRLPGMGNIKVNTMKPGEFQGLQLKFGDILLEKEMENPLALVSGSELAIN